MFAQIPIELNLEPVAKLFYTRLYIEFHVAYRSSGQSL